MAPKTKASSAKKASSTQTSRKTPARDENGQFIKKAKAPAPKKVATSSAKKATPKTGRKPAVKSQKAPVSKAPVKVVKSAKTVAKKSLTSATSSAAPNNSVPPAALAGPKPKRMGGVGILPARSFLRWALILFAVLSVLTWFVANRLMQTRTAEHFESQYTRLSVLAKGQSDVLNTWIDGKFASANTMVNADLVRLFTTEMGKALNANSQPPRPLLAQLPYMRQSLKEFVRRNNFVEAHILSDQGKFIVSSKPSTGLSDDQRNKLRATISSGQEVVLPLRMAANQLVLDLQRPIQALNDDGSSRIVGVLQFTIPAEDALVQVVTPNTLSAQGERAFLLQNLSSNAVELVRPRSLSRLEGTLANLRTRVAAENTATPSAIDRVKSIGTLQGVTGTPFVILQERLAKPALAPLKTYKKAMVGYMALASLLLLLGILFIVARLLAQRNAMRVMHQEKVLQASIRAVEIRDPYLAGHYARIARLATQVGTEMGFSVKERSTLYYGALVSGFGKIFIPQEILTKKGKLTPKEWTVMKSHVAHTLDVLDDIDFQLPIKGAVGQMYERLDGSGYPHALKGSQIGALPRVLAVADAYSALTRPRSYRNELPAAEALSILKDDSDKYDAGVVAALQRVVNRR